MPESSLARRFYLPIVAVLIFLCFYTAAAHLYPGGTEFDAARLGFSFVDNCWCDLFDEPTSGGHHNPGRPVALVGIIILCSGLAVFWWNLPALFSTDAIRKKWLVRSNGLISALLIPLIGHPTHHDTIVDLASIFGLVAFVASLSALKSRSASFPTGLGLATLILVFVNLVVWKSGAGLLLLPLLQKFAFASFLSWIVLISYRTVNTLHR